jgi:cation diffusion facilitator CzcD-associated flavoprotein CzcO
MKPLIVKLMMRGANMKKERLIVIGGNGAGMSGASRARRLRPDMEILVFEKSGHVSYAA